jgi:hypothetical protein
LPRNKHCFVAGEVGFGTRGFTQLIFIILIVVSLRMSDPLESSLPFSD